MKDRGPLIESLTLLRERIEDFDAYPFSVPAIRSLNTLDLHPRVTFLIGENGSGKSTLAEAIAVASGFNPEGGSRSMRFATHDSVSPVHEFLRIRRGHGRGRPRDGYFLRAESYYNVATEIERRDEEVAALNLRQPGRPLIDAYGGIGLHEQSHGEAFLALLLHRFGREGLYILDEPEAALSPSRQLAVLRRIHDLVRQDSQFVIATHSPILMAYPDSKILELSASGLREVDYEETDHFLTTRDFLNHRDRFLGDLLGE